MCVSECECAWQTDLVPADAVVQWTTFLTSRYPGVTVVSFDSTGAQLHGIKGLGKR